MLRSRAWARRLIADGCHDSGSKRPAVDHLGPPRSRHGWPGIGGCPLHAQHLAVQDSLPTSRDGRHVADQTAAVAHALLLLKSELALAGQRNLVILRKADASRARRTPKCSSFVRGLCVGFLVATAVAQCDRLRINGRKAKLRLPARSVMLLLKLCENDVQERAAANRALHLSLEKNARVRRWWGGREGGGGQRTVLLGCHLLLHQRPAQW